MDKFCPGGRVSGKIEAPASKSYAQRAVAAALLCEGTSLLRGMELCNDTAAALDVAVKLGARVVRSGDEEYTVTGGIRDGLPVAREAEVNIGESGLSARMFTPIASLCRVPVTIRGEGSILTRPIDMITRPLESLGVSVASNGGYLPVTVRGPLLGGTAQVDGSVSSQFLTGLLMALPLAGDDTTLHVSRATSKPYIDMTVGLLADFGIRVENDDYKTFRIEGRQKYIHRTYDVEGDWSGASCLLVAGAIAGEVTVKNLNPHSVQADVAILEALANAGARVETADGVVRVSQNALRGFEFDATDCPDLFPALVALGSCCAGKTVIKGTSRLAHKESDRAAALQQEFGRMGIGIDLSVPDTMIIGGGEIKGTRISSHNDHRIAMAAGVAALRSTGGITVEDAGAVDKSYPGFWDDLDAIRIS